MITIQTFAELLAIIQMVRLSPGSRRPNHLTFVVCPSRHQMSRLRRQLWLMWTEHMTVDGEQALLTDLWQNRGWTALHKRLFWIPVIFVICVFCMRDIFIWPPILGTNKTYTDTLWNALDESTSLSNGFLWFIGRTNATGR